MARIVTISGTDDIPETPLSISGFETEGEMDLKIARQSAELELGMAERIAGIGSPEASSVGRTLGYLNQALRVVHDGDQVAGIGAVIGKSKAAKQKVAKPSKQAKKAAKAAKVPARTGKTKRVANLIKKAGASIKKTTKAFVKVATAPQRLAVKAVGEVAIPKMAMFFLYLFVTNPTTIAALPAKVKRKRAKAEKFAKFMTNIIGMKQDHFMKLVRNGIVRQKKQTPEQLLALYVKGSISGPGVGDIGVVTDIISIVIQVIQQLVKAFGKKPAPDETPTAEDMPDPATDFREMSAAVTRQVLTHLAYKPESQKGHPAAPPAMEAREQAQEASALEQLAYEPADTPVEAPLPEPAPETTDETSVEENFNQAGGEAEPPTGPKAPAAPAPSPAASSANSLLLPLGVAVALVAVAAS